MGINKKIITVNDFLSSIGVESNPKTRRVVSCFLEMIYSLEQGCVLKGENVILEKVSPEICFLMKDENVLADNLFDYLKINNEVVINDNENYGNKREQ